MPTFLFFPPPYDIVSLYVGLFLFENVDFFKFVGSLIHVYNEF